MGGLLTSKELTETGHNHKLGKTALVLSAGGMFGSYQAGVWQVLSDVVQPDLVVGASIGSLNGWLIAGGCHPDDILQRWLTLEKAAHHRWRLPASLSDGMIDCGPLNEWIRGMYQEFQPKTEYALVTTQLRTLRPRLFRTPGITWKHLAASCAVPLFLHQHRIDSVIHSDGGLIDPLPVWAAVDLGATRLITVNLLKHRPLLIRAISNAGRLYSRQRKTIVDRLEVVDISPAEPLGTARDSIRWTRQNAERWIAMGQKDARHAKHLVVECFGRLEGVAPDGCL
ncbi:MAG TPA: patatin-like phospholipase family protein [Bryobacteraceae bacterium]|nr:patatin-like phospholipase family protein [Bryobacteraceae bacterium]